MTGVYSGEVPKVPSGNTAVARAMWPLRTSV